MSDDKAVSRRWLLVSIGVLLNGAVALLIATPVVGYLLGPIRRNGGYNSWIDLGDISQFALGQTRLASFVSPHSVPWDGATSKAACWVRRTKEETFQVFAINCAHLGCPVRYVSAAERFICPCHGGVYDFRGMVAGGPPVRPLDRFYTRMNQQTGLVELGPRYSVNSELVRFSPRDPGEPLDGIGQYLYPSRFDTAKRP